MLLPRSRWLQAGLLLLVAIATRFWQYGNPVIHSDEQFYLLVGDRLLQGAWPYVDVFDRKPVGLFLIFAGIRAVGGDGVLGYQLAATLVVAATAFLITRIARRFAGPAPAFAGGVLYLVWLMVFDGLGGQSAVWQNLFTAAAALPALDAIRTRERVPARGAVAMLCFGLAMQVKYVALFEGVFFGVALLWANWRGGRAPLRVVADGALWVALALLPTALAWGVYAAAGHGDAFVFANFLSIFGQEDQDSFRSDTLKALAGIGLSLPLLLLAWVGRRRAGAAAWWVVAAIVAIGIMGTFEQHYWLPLPLPLCVAAAAGLEARGHKARRDFALALAFGLVAGVLLTHARIGRRGNAAEIARAVEMIGQRPDRCLFTYGSEQILYYLTHSCLPTPYVFRSHLGQATELKGLPVDPRAEIARVLAARPGTIMFRDPKPTTDPVTERQVKVAIAASYARVGEVRIGNMRHTVYRLRRDEP